MLLRFCINKSDYSQSKHGTGTLWGPKDTRIANRTACWWVWKKNSTQPNTKIKLPKIQLLIRFSIVEEEKFLRPLSLLRRKLQ